MSAPAPARTQRTSAPFITRTTCRFCDSEQLVKIWSFGPTPLANAYILPEEAGKPELLVPLDVYWCGHCHLVQLRDVVDPELLFSQYTYLSSTSAVFRAHFAQYAQAVKEKLSLNEKSFVVDVGSNDGILLRPFQEEGVRVLGIEPAANIAAMASIAGVETVSAFFTPELAHQVATKYGRADVICANNVFAHTDTVDVFVDAVQELLTDTGTFIFEVQYLGDLLEKNLFDIVYHEHVCYYHVAPLISFFASRGMEVFDVERVPVHGGSIRVFVQRRGGPHLKHERLQAILEEEKKRGLDTLSPYQAFAQRVEDNRQVLQAMLRDLKSQGKTIVGYGAPAKATTLLYALGIDSTILDFIADDDAKIKQGRLMPGSHIPIVAPDKLYSAKPDYCLILAWNFAEPIMKAHSRFTEQGGKFIIPVPKPTIV